MTNIQSSDNYYLTVAEVADIIRMSHHQVWNLIRTGLLKAYRFSAVKRAGKGKQSYRISRSDLDNFIADAKFVPASNSRRHEQRQ